MLKLKTPVNCQKKNIKTNKNNNCEAGRKKNQPPLKIRSKTKNKIKYPPNIFHISNVGT